MTEEQEVFLKHIQKKGLKRTAQRDLILEVFLNTEGHMSGKIFTAWCAKRSDSRTDDCLSNPTVADGSRAGA
jgi:Fe2+ or Zn2+ uptake regulation protein